MLCPMEHWTQYDGNFNHEAFFNNIAKLFESAPGHPWILETLASWDKYVHCSSVTFCHLGRFLDYDIGQRKRGSQPSAALTIVVMTILQMRISPNGARIQYVRDP
jgi:hypothetical protein